MASVYSSPSIQTHNLFCVGGFTESQNSNAVVDRLNKNLNEKYGITVYRNSPSMETISEIIRDSNSKNPNIHVAIHSNAGGGRGCEVYCGYTAQSKALAQYIYEEMAAVTPASDRGVKNGMALGEINGTNAYACLIEMSFHDNADDAAWMINNRQACATAIEKGICRYFGIEYKTDVVPQPAPEPEPAPAPAEQIYRVRKNWTDGYADGNQAGAYKDLDGAKECADRNPGYSVFDDSGNIVYEPVPAPEPAPVTISEADYNNLVAANKALQALYDQAQAELAETKQKLAAAESVAAESKSKYDNLITGLKALL